MTQSWPDLAALELLVAIGDHHGLGAGARAIGMAQPNASRAIAALEASLKVSLITRHPRGSKLTEEGGLLVDWARPVLDAARALSTASASLAAGQATTMVVHASMTIAEHLMPTWLARLHRDQPDADVRLEVCNSEAVFAAVREGRCTLGFVETPRLPGDLHSTVVAVDRLLVVVDPTHPWASRSEPLTGAELAATPLIVREPGSGTRETLDHALEPWPSAEPSLQLGSNAAVRASVRAGLAPAVLSELAVASELAHGELVAVEVSGLSLDRALHAVWSTPRLRGSAATLLRLAVAHSEGR